MEPRFFSFGKKTALFDFVSRPQLNFQERPIPTSAHFRPPRCTSKGRVYTKIDLKHAYHLVWISPGDKWKTALQTHYGSFKWLVMPEGFTNAPAAFQRFMNEIFMDMIDIIVIIYLDDILIYFNNISKHKA